MPELPKLPGASHRPHRLASLASRAKRSVGAAQRKTQQQIKDEEIFSHYVLNKDPEASKYMPYDEVAYARPSGTYATNETHAEKHAARARLRDARSSRRGQVVSICLGSFGRLRGTSASRARDDPRPRRRRDQ